MTQPQTTVLVLMGGPDAERDVSLMSGKEVAEALRQAGRFDVIEQVVDRPGASELAKMPGDAVFPVLHGQWGEGGGLQRELELLDRPYVGSTPDPAALAMDKLLTKDLVESHGVRTPEAYEIHAGDACALRLPVVIKPVDDGSSVDIRICHNDGALEAARAELHRRRSRLMVERYIHGREVTVGIVHGEPLPIVEIAPASAFYDYAAKYDRDDTGYVVRPTLPREIIDRAISDSMLTWELIGCRDIARVDFRIDADGVVWFLEINTMPGFTSHSLVPMAAREAGMNMPELCASLVDAALERTRREMEVKPTHTSFVRE